MLFETSPLDPETEVLSVLEPGLTPDLSLLAGDEEPGEERRAAPGDDPVQPEAELGRRIESGQIELLRALVAIPMARRALIDLGECVERGESSADEVFLASDGTGIDAKGLRRLLRAVG